MRIPLPKQVEKVHYVKTKYHRKKVATREVYSCPICGWESFDPNAYESPCGQDNCTGTLTDVHREPYEV
jgi:hypothetical protein